MTGVRLESAQRAGAFSARQAKRGRSTLLAARCWLTTRHTSRVAHSADDARHRQASRNSYTRRGGGRRTRILVAHLGNGDRFSATRSPSRVAGSYGGDHEWGSPSPPPPLPDPVLARETGNRATRTALVHRSRGFVTFTSRFTSYNTTNARFLPSASEMLERMYVFAIESALTLNYGETKQTWNCYIARWKRKKRHD